VVASAGCASIVETFPDEGDMRGGKQISRDSWSLYPAPCCSLYLLTSCGVKVVLGRTEAKYKGKRHEGRHFKNGLMYFILSD